MPQGNGFLKEYLNFWDSLLESISGEATRKEREKILAAQLGLSQEQLAQQLEIERLKSNPELAAQRTKMVLYIVGGVVVLVLGYFIIRFVVFKSA